MQARSHITWNQNCVKEGRKGSNVFHGLNLWLVFGLLWLGSNRGLMAHGFIIGALRVLGFIIGAPRACGSITGALMACGSMRKALMAWGSTRGILRAYGSLSGALRAYGSITAGTWNFIKKMCNTLERSIFCILGSWGLITPCYTMPVCPDYSESMNSNGTNLASFFMS